VEFDFSHADYSALTLALSVISWDSILLPCTSIDTAWDLFCATLHTLFLQHVPRKKRSSPRSVPLLPKSLLDLIHLKRAAWSKYRRSHTDADKGVFSRLSKLVKSHMCSFTREKEAEVLQSGSLKSFFRFIKSKLSPGVNQSILLTDGGSFLSPDDCASVFNCQFAKAFTVDSKNMATFPMRFAGSMPPIEFSPLKITPYLLGQKDSLTVGPDGLPQSFFKNCASSLSIPLSIIFSLSYSSSTIPSVWKSAYVTPVFKGSGSAHSPDNYRPISHTCIASKIMELIIRDNILAFLLSNSLLSPSQHGFVPGKSTTTQLLQTLNDWTLSLDVGKNIDCIYLDFSKAFDCISHSKLISKISSYGIDPIAVLWIRDFLLNRRQCVKVNGTTSGWLPCTSGVPQGSVLGPLLFSVFINDLPDVVLNATIKMFADDVKLYMPVCNLIDHTLLQADLNRVAAWAANWQLSLNVKKCILFRLKPDLNCPSYLLNNTMLNIPGVVKDLGIYLTPTLDFSYHCNHIAGIALRRCHLILSTFATRDHDFLVRLFITYVRPKLEYASQVWSPFLLSNIDKIESVLRHFTKSLPGLGRLSYSERLRVLNLQSLEIRRLRADCIMVQKLRLGYIHIPYASFFTNQSSVATRRDLRSGNDRLHIPISHLNLRTFSFTVRAARIWNHLPLFVTNNLVSINLFKHNLLDSHLHNFVRGRALQGQ
jgi:hypothetical protein